MKYNNINFFQLSNDIIENEVCQNLSDSAFRLLVYLKQKEHRLSKCRNGRTFFWRTDEKIAKDLGKNIKTIKKAKKELIDADLIETSLIPFRGEMNGSYTKKHVTVYHMRI